MTQTLPCTGPMGMSTPAQRFPLGQVVGTPSALALMDEHNINAVALLQRHQAGDWGDACPADVQANEAALLQGCRLISVYRSRAGTIWVITEADRSVTTMLRPEDY